uniref:EF-hand domain-containing protein n=2 Tax=Parascaris TaxID=6254 RepID=A0A914ZEG4_PARUN
MAVNFTPKELSETFDLLDVDHDGRLSRGEISALLRAINVEPTRIELDFIFKEMDADKTGKISKEEFVRYMSAPPKHRTTIGELEKQFRQFDRDGDGAITQEELEEMLSETASLNDRNAIAEMFHATDTNGDGRITFIEFVNMMKE